jgi:hypothetical protein
MKLTCTSVNATKNRKKLEIIKKIKIGIWKEKFNATNKTSKCKIIQQPGINRSQSVSA